MQLSMQLSEHLGALSQPLKNPLFLAVSKCDFLAHSPKSTYKVDAYLVQAEGSGSRNPELQAEQ